MASNHRDDRSVGDFILIWLDSPKNQERNPTIDCFQELVNSIYLFTDCDQCLDFISDIKNEKIFLISSDRFARQISPAIEFLPQLDSIYLLCERRDEIKKWTKSIRKIRGVFTRLHPIYDAFRRDLRQCDDNLIPLSISASKDLEKDDFHSRFLYRQLITEILLDQNYQTQSKDDFVRFCQENYSENEYQSKLIEDFRKDSQPSAAIRWFTRDCFLSAMLNKALRMEDIDTILRLDFFIRELHQNIERLHRHTRLTVYRGQGITENGFGEILEHADGGYLAFNHFFMASTDKKVALGYARAARDGHQLYGVLFHIEIDSTDRVVTSLDKMNFDQEASDQYLFTINTIFRIIHVAETADHLWLIKLQLANKEDDDLKRMRKFIRRDLEGKSASERIELLIDQKNSQMASLEKKETDQILPQQNIQTETNDLPKEEPKTSPTVTSNQ